MFFPFLILDLDCIFVLLHFLIVVNDVYVQTKRLASLSDCNWIRTNNHLVHKRTLNHLAKLATGFTLKRVRDMTRTYSH